MARRKRLSPAIGMGQGAGVDAAPGPLGAPPIAQVAGQAAHAAAAQTLADEMARARIEGRLVQDIALDDIDALHLMRDRIVTEAEDMAALEASISARGLQMPVDLVDLGQDARPRYGLISGWRRLTAIRALHARTGEARFGSVRAVLRRPETAADAYLSMVEENELRVGLSYYERAQVAARAAEAEVFASVRAAVMGLFPTASKAKRSKISAFARIYRLLDPVLTFPDMIPERLGLRLAKAIDAGQGGDLYRDLGAGKPCADPAEEQARILSLLGGGSGTGTAAARKPAGRTFPGDVRLQHGAGKLTLSGGGIDAALLRDLETWLEARQGGGG